MNDWINVFRKEISTKMRILKQMQLFCVDLSEDIVMVVSWHETIEIDPCPSELSNYPIFPSFK
jgi:hypothetical protein